MPKQRSELEAAAGQLVLVIQKELGREIGESSAPESEAVMNTSHGLLQAAKRGELETELGGRTVAEYLGKSWVGRHPQVMPAVKRIEVLIKGKHPV